MRTARYDLATVLSIGIVACLVAATPAGAGTISIGWNPVSHPDLAGYRVYYDTTPGAFGSHVDLGLVTSTNLGGLADCTNYEIAIKAFDGAGNESAAFSNVVGGWARPRLDLASPAVLERGAQLDVTIDGANFQPGATVKFAHPSITVTAVNVQSCTRLTASVSIGAQAATGAVDVRVVNPDSVFGETVSLVSVAPDGTPPSITAVSVGAVGATSASVSWTSDEAADSQVFYRAAGETGYQQTPLDPALVTAHAVALQGLMPSTTYQVHVRSADAAGNAAVSTPDVVFTTQSSSFTYLRVEAEAGDLTPPLAAASGSGAFSSAWVELPAGSPPGQAGQPTGTAQLGFHVPYQADWGIWLRVRGTAPDGDSWFESVDGAAAQPVLTTTTGVWEWLPGRTYALGAGLHSLTLGGSEGEARVDRIVITDDPGFLPTEQPGDDADPPDPVQGLGATPGDRVNVLAWTNPLDADPLTIVIRYRTDGTFPAHPADGLPVAALAGVSGGQGGYTHGSLTNGTTYSYGVFAVDPTGNASVAATVGATPLGVPPGTVTNLTRTDTE